MKFMKAINVTKSNKLMTTMKFQRNKSKKLSQTEYMMQEQMDKVVILRKKIEKTENRMVTIKIFTEKFTRMIVQ